MTDRLPGPRVYPVTAAAKALDITPPALKGRVTRKKLRGWDRDAPNNPFGQVMVDADALDAENGPLQVPSVWLEAGPDEAPAIVDPEFDDPRVQQLRMAEGDATQARLALIEAVKAEAAAKVAAAEQRAAIAETENARLKAVVAQLTQVVTGIPFATDRPYG